MMTERHRTTSGGRKSERPFRRRRRSPLADDDEDLNRHHEHQHPTTLSSAIAIHLHQRLPDLHPTTTTITATSSHPSDETSDIPTTTATTTRFTQKHHHHQHQYQNQNHRHHHEYSHRYSLGAAAGRQRRKALPKLSFSLPLLMALSLVACVLMSLSNLIALNGASSNMQPNMLFVLAVGASSPASPVVLSPMSVQQQQSNSVIQYPSTSSSSSATVAGGPTSMLQTSPKARYKTMYACEDRQLTMDCDAGSKINLIRANFGRFSITQCNEQGQLDLSTDCMSPITFRIMQERCQDKQRCSVNATSTLFGDKCPKTRKYLEVHFQCQMMEPDQVDLRKSSMMANGPPAASSSPIYNSPITPVKPPNNPSPPPGYPGRHHTSAGSYGLMNNNNFNQQQQQQQPGEEMNVHPQVGSSIEVTNNNNNNQQQQQQQQQPTPVINSNVMSSANAIIMNQQQSYELGLNSLPLDLPNNNSPPQEPYVISLHHFQIENMSNPRCYQWDSGLRQWTDRGARILQTNQTNTICAFDQATSYVLVMDYSGPMQTISPSNPTKSNAINLQPSYKNPNMGPPVPDLFDTPQPINSNGIANNNYLSPDSTFDINKMIHPPTPSNLQQQQHQHQQQQQSSSKLFTLFGYLLGIIVVAVALMTLTFIASSMRSSAGAAFKSLGSFAPFGGPKHKHRRQDGAGGNGGPAGKNGLLVVNNSNGHQFIYAPASTTKISSSSSTHILSASGGGSNPHQGTLHRLQQQQLYSGNGATLSSLSGTGAQSNNYYYGLMGLNPLFQQQQQQQQHHFSQHHLNQQQQQPAPAQQLANAHSQQVASYNNHQANKSTMSQESATNSSSSSSGVESGSTSMQQHQVQTQQACLVSAMNNNDFNLMGHHISNYGRHPSQQLNNNNLFATMKSHQQAANFALQQQPTLTVNAHYSTSGGGMQSLSSTNNSNNSMTPNQAQAQAMLHSRQASGQMRDHIYECVDDDKPYMARLLMPTGQQQQQVVEQSPHLQQGQPQQAFSTWRDHLRYKCVALPVPKVV